MCATIAFCSGCALLSSDEDVNNQEALQRNNHCLVSLFHYHERRVELRNASALSEAISDSEKKTAFANQEASGKNFRLYDLFNILMKSGEHSLVTKSTSQ